MSRWLAAPVWLAGGVLVVLVLGICGTERMYQRAIGLIRALRGAPDQPTNHGPPTI